MFSVLLDGSPRFRTTHRSLQAMLGWIGPLVQGREVGIRDERGTVAGGRLCHGDRPLWLRHPGHGAPPSAGHRPHFPGPLQEGHLNQAPEARQEREGERSGEKQKRDTISRVFVRRRILRHKCELRVVRWRDSSCTQAVLRSRNDRRPAARRDQAASGTDVLCCLSFRQCSGEDRSRHRGPRTLGGGHTTVGAPPRSSTEKYAQEGTGPPPGPILS
jgi:hypothetical protein